MPRMADDPSVVLSMNWILQCHNAMVHRMSTTHRAGRVTSRELCVVRQVMIEVVGSV